VQPHVGGFGTGLEPDPPPAATARGDTPNFTRMAEEGLRFNRFHVTALCSPTRAALLTGRNNHAVGFGSVGEFSSGFPGYTAMLPRDCAPLPRILKDNGKLDTEYDGDA